MIDHETLFLRGQFGWDWALQLNLLNAFPATQEWMKRFDKLIVCTSEGFGVWRDIYDFLTDGRWEVMNNMRIQQIHDEYDALIKANPGDDHKKYRADILKMKTQEVKARERAMKKIKKNAAYIRRTFLEGGTI